MTASLFVLRLVALLGLWALAFYFIIRRRRNIVMTPATGQRASQLYVMMFLIVTVMIALQLYQFMLR
ncbi:MAG: hypothetical protein JO193_04520 [Candidatus Eremiobacteraeota bacterium]|nr:hypothetical protein [Candidatus Eremiobacteraeota bacterium]MBV9973343.1 hypothetical protein [Candidatus Eremiobacteraeota bacterium]